MSARTHSEGPCYRSLGHPDEIEIEKHALIEASAGTGKTYTIEQLVLRLVRDAAVPIDQILVVTFTEKATGELKTRIRAKLQAAYRDLAENLEARDESQQSQAVVRLGRAIDNFDNAAIYTIHGFCHMVLTRYGFELGRPLEAEVVDDKPLIESLLKERMRAVWPAQYGPDLRELLEFSGYPDYDPRLQISRWERRVRHIVQASIEPPRTRPAPFASPARLLAGFRELRSRVREILRDLRELTGPLDPASAHRSAFAQRFARLNQKAASRDRKLRDIVIPLLELLGEHGGDSESNESSASSDSGGSGESGAARRFLSEVAGGLSATGGFRTLSEDHWTKAGDNIAEVCPELHAIVERLEDLRALNFEELEHALAAETIAALHGELARYKFQRGFVSFNDMLSLVDRALVDSRALAETLRDLYRYAIVDEFQDTDRVQWEIFRKLYLGEGARGILILVGDPKQAIYGFRGADVYAYFAARSALEGLATGKRPRAALYRLTTNYRSVPGLVRSFNELFAAPAFFGADVVPADGIGYTAVAECAPEQRKFQVRRDTSGRASLHFVDLDDAGSGTAAKRSYFRFLAREIRELVESGTVEISAAGEQARPLNFGDICILLRAKSDAPLVEDSLDRMRVPHSFYKKTGLYQTVEALELSLVLAAIAAPANLEAGYKALLTRFLRFTPEQVDELRMADSAGEYEPAFRSLLVRWHGDAIARNWPAFFRSLLHDSLALIPDESTDDGDPGYERRIANYEQLCDDLGEYAVRENHDLTGVIEHLEFLRGEIGAVREEWDIHRQESEAARVRILTIHTAKGLEFPVVFLAGGFTRRSAHQYESFEYHDETGTRVYDLMRADEEAFRREEEDEDRRLYYVALTRAALKLYVPYFRPPPGRGAHQAGPITRFLREAIDAAYPDGQEHPDVRFVSASLAYESRDTFGASGPGDDRDPSVAPALSGAPGLALPLDDERLFPAGPAHVNRRRRDLYSYTALSQARFREVVARVARDEFEDSARERGDIPAGPTGHAVEPALPFAAEGSTASQAATASLVPPGLAQTPPATPTTFLQDFDRRLRGIDAGIMLHDLLEHLDYTGVGGDAETLELTQANRRLIAGQLRRHALLANLAADEQAAENERAAVDFVGHMLRRVLAAPLTGDAVGLSLKTLRPADRIHEMEFYFHIPALRRLEGVPQEDAAMRIQDGYVFGFIDLVFRYGGRYYLADWKSNVLADYTETDLALAMDERNYHLQYRIYTHALVRWLGQQRSDFLYERDFGGVYYFFLRGMDPDRPGRGVYFTRPTLEENEELIAGVRGRASV